VLHYAVVMRSAAEFSNGLCTAAQDLAIAAYKDEYGDASSVIRGVLSAGYVRQKVLSGAGDGGAVKDVSFLFSSFLEEDDRIRLVMNYHVNPPLSLFSLPFNFFRQNVVVRGWTGREGSAATGGTAEAEADEDPDQIVYVTEHGTVFHTDPYCTHLALSIQTVDLDTVGERRNTDGEKYRPCEHCGGNCSGTVYITKDGNRYHSSLECQGLKRTVSEVRRGTASETLRPCSRCASHSHSHAESHDHD